MSAHHFGNQVKETKRHKLSMRLGEVTRHLLLMRATPHSGKPEDFDLFMATLDYDRFAGQGAGQEWGDRRRGPSAQSRGRAIAPRPGHRSRLGAQRPITGGDPPADSMVTNDVVEGQ